MWKMSKCFLNGPERWNEVSERSSQEVRFLLYPKK